MKAQELKTKSVQELEQMSVNLKRELFNLRFQKVNGELTNTSAFRKAKKDVARVKTVIRELESKTGGVK